MGTTDEAMTARAATLTERQRACLRLVLKGYETKEIARLIAISPERASKDIKAAMAKLGVSRRIDAARILEQMEGAHDGPGLAQALLATVQTAPPMSLPIADWQRDYGSGGAAANAADQPPIEFSMPFRKRGSGHNDLGPWQRVIWIALITAFILSAFGVLAGGLAWLSTSVGSTKQ
ncbi:MAG: helix-turn-helix transcriptional regulator [Pseudomonadota bacterium]